jgi:uncharacterized protein YlxW (UPF0749 family)
MAEKSKKSRLAAFLFAVFASALLAQLSCDADGGHGRKQNENLMRANETASAENAALKIEIIKLQNRLEQLSYDNKKCGERLELLKMATFSAQSAPSGEDEIHQ